MSISEQVRRLRKEAKFHKDKGIYLYALLKEAADTIESLSAKLADMERSAEVCGGGWILCSEKLPEEKINPVTDDFYEYQVTFKIENVTDVRHYKFGDGHWWNGPCIMDKYVTAWRELPEPYHEP